MKSIPDDEVAPEVVAHENTSGSKKSEKNSDLLKALGISWNNIKGYLPFPDLVYFITDS